MACAASSAVPPRCIGTKLAPVARSETRACRRRRGISVSIGPGRTALTRMPGGHLTRQAHCHHVSRSAWRRRVDPHIWPGEPMRVAALETLTIAPPLPPGDLAVLMRRTASRAHKKRRSR